MGNHSGSASTSSVAAVAADSSCKAISRCTPAWAPGHALSTARSTSPGGMVRGTHSEMSTESESATTSHAR